MIDGQPYWKVSPRNGYWAIDEKRHNRLGTFGNPIVLLGSQKDAEKIANKLNEVYQRGADEALKNHQATYDCVLESERGL